MTSNAEIEAMRASAMELKALAQTMSAANAEFGNVEVTASNESGSVTATVRRDGTVTALTLSEAWRSSLTPAQVGPAILGTIRLAHMQLAAQWNEAVDNAAPSTARLEMPPAPRRQRATAEQLAERLDAIVAASDEMAAYKSALRSGGLDDSTPSPGGFFTVHCAGSSVTALEADDYRFTFASAGDIADDARAAIAAAADRASTRDSELADRFPGLSALRGMRDTL